jgi:dihydroneopterin aldolase
MLHSTIELTDLQLNTDIGTYGPEHVVPSAHLLDLTLSIDPALVLIETDGMAHVFDCDPLISEIDELGISTRWSLRNTRTTDHTHCRLLCLSATDNRC